MQRFLRLLISAMAVMFSANVLADSFMPNMPQRKPEPRAAFVNIAIGSTHGGTTIGGTTTRPVNGGNYYRNDDVTLGGEQYYALGAIVPLGRSMELWASYAQMSDDASLGGGGYVTVTDPNFKVLLKHDRIEALLFFKVNRLRFGGGVVHDRDIHFSYRYTTSSATVNHINSDTYKANGVAVGVGLDMPFEEDGTALHFDFRYVRMKYKLYEPNVGIPEDNYDANSIGYYLSLSF